MVVVVVVVTATAASVVVVVVVVVAVVAVVSQFILRPLSPISCIVSPHYEAHIKKDITSVRSTH